MNFRKAQWFISAYFRRHRWAVGGLLGVVLVSAYLLRTAPAEPVAAWVQHSFFTERYSEGLVGTPQTLNPLLATSDSERDLTRILFRGLTKTSLDGTTSGDLAASWEVSTSGQVYLFHLKPGQKFSNGDPITVDDIIFTYELARDPVSNSVYAATFKNLEVQRVGDNSVLFRLRDAFSPFLALTDLGILPKSILGKVDPKDIRSSKFNLNPVGSSSFHLKSIDKEGAVLTQGGNEYVFRFYDTSDDLKTALKLGEIKAAGFTEPVDFSGWSNLQVMTSPLYRRFVGLFYNLRSGMTADKNIRQGLTYAIDKDNILTNILKGSADPALSPIPTISWARSDNLRQYSLDLAKAKADLDKSGFTGRPVRSKSGAPLEIRISYRDTAINKSLAQAIAQDWARVNVRAVLEPLSAAGFFDKVVRNKDFQAAILTQEVGVDPDQYVLWHTTQADDANISGIKLPKLDKSLEDARKEVDQTTRKSLYADFQRFFLDEDPVAFLYQPKYTYVVNSKVQGIDLKPLGAPSDRFSDISNWKIQNKLF